MPVLLRPIETEVEYMEDLDVGFISLVDKGANHVPFKIIKSEDSMDDVIQSVVTPLNKSLADFEAPFFSSDFSIAKTENHGEYTKHISFPVSDLKEDSIRLVRLSEDESAFIVVGQPKVPSESHIVYKASIMDMPVKLSEMGVKTFGDDFYSELTHLIDSVSGTMSLEKLENKKKKAAIANALDAFRIFISAGLDMNSGQTNIALREPVKFEKKDNTSEVESMEVTNTEVEKMDAMGTQPGMNSGVSDPVPLTMSEIQNQVFKNQEEMTNLISALTQKVESLVESLTKKTETNEEMTGKGIPSGDEGITTPMPDMDPFSNLQKMEDMMSKVVSKVEKLEELVEKIDGDVPEPSAPVETVVKAEQSTAPESPFAGIFNHLKR